MNYFLNILGEAIVGYFFVPQCPAENNLKIKMTKYEKKKLRNALKAHRKNNVLRFRAFNI